MDLINLLTLLGLANVCYWLCKLFEHLMDTTNNRIFKAIYSLCFYVLIIPSIPYMFNLILESNEISKTRNESYQEGFNAGCTAGAEQKENELIVAWEPETLRRQGYNAGYWDGLKKHSNDLKEAQAQIEKLQQEVAVLSDVQSVLKAMKTGLPAYSKLFEVPLRSDVAMRLQSALSEKMEIKEKTNGYVVVEGSSGKVYHTSLKRCTCPDCTYRGTPCKHMLYLLLNLSMAEHVQRATSNPMS